MKMFPPRMACRSMSQWRRLLTRSCKARMTPAPWRVGIGQASKTRMPSTQSRVESYLRSRLRMLWHRRSSRKSRSGMPCTTAHPAHCTCPWCNRCTRWSFFPKRFRRCMHCTPLRLCSYSRRIRSSSPGICLSMARARTFPSGMFCTPRRCTCTGQGCNSSTSIASRRSVRRRSKIYNHRVGNEGSRPYRRPRCTCLLGRARTRRHRRRCTCPRGIRCTCRWIFRRFHWSISRRCS
jgi:hypothetical protein